MGKLTRYTFFNLTSCNKDCYYFKVLHFEKVDTEMNIVHCFVNGEGYVDHLGLFFSKSPADVATCTDFKIILKCKK